MDDDYTPTTFEVLEAWADSRWDQYGERKWSDHAAEFNRWVANVKAETWDEACEALAWAVDNGTNPAAYVAEAADLAWDRTVTFLHRHLDPAD